MYVTKDLVIVELVMSCASSVTLSFHVFILF